MVTLAEAYAINESVEVRELIGVFVKMVEWWAAKAGSMLWRRYDSLRAMFYRDWLKSFPAWSSQLAYTSALEAFSRLRLNKPPEERAAAAELDLPAAVLHPKMLKVEGGLLRVTARRSGEKYIYVGLKPFSRHQKRLLEQAEKGLWSLGQATLTEKWVVLPFTASRLDSHRLKIITEILEG